MSKSDRIFKLNICPRSNKHQKNIIIEINTRDIKKLGTNIRVSMHMATNSNK